MNLVNYVINWLEHATFVEFTLSILVLALIIRFVEKAFYAIDEIWGIEIEVKLEDEFYPSAVVSAPKTKKKISYHSVDLKVTPNEIRIEDIKLNFDPSE